MLRNKIISIVALATIGLASPTGAFARGGGGGHGGGGFHGGGGGFHGGGGYRGGGGGGVPAGGGVRGAVNVAPRVYSAPRAAMRSPGMAAPRVQNFAGARGFQPGHANFGGMAGRAPLGA